jgi:hypothetical protein
MKKDATTKSFYQYNQDAATNDFTTNEFYNEYFL